MSQEHVIRLGDIIRLAPENPHQHTPIEINSFLVALGWYPNGTFWSHHTKERNFMTWEQAVACEFYEFITLGGR